MESTSRSTRLPALVELSGELTPEFRETLALKIEQHLPVLGFVIPGVGALSGTARRAYPPWIVR